MSNGDATKLFVYCVIGVAVALIILTWVAYG
jgi:hypothetical protein